MHGEQLVIRVGLDERSLRFDQVQPHEHGERTADKKHQRDGAEVQQRDALVVGGEKPRLDAVIRVEIMNARRFRRDFPLHVCNRGTHFAFVFLSSGPSDFTYAINCSTCSSLIWPWKVGMIGG